MSLLKWIEQQRKRIFCLLSFHRWEWSRERGDLVCRKCGKQWVEDYQ